MSERYRKSEELLLKAFKTIPLASQTFSKSKMQYPFGASPFFLTRGKGSRVWDVDGNEYVDFINGLLTITLGYGDPDVNRAVSEQLESGTIFSLASPIEMEVAEKIVEMVPCAEMVRFGKNGSDATAGAIRLARAYTKRDHVAVCGYHGWQDWYIGSTSRNLGVPKSTKDLTHTFIYNDLDSLHNLFKEYPDQIAAVILEPMNSTEPNSGFLEGVREITRKNSAVMVFDEIITGFRFAKGGAQEYFGVTPDLTTLGKGISNGYPLSAVAGKADIMRLMEEIFFSFTFGGETLSLAASLAALNKIQNEPVIEKLWRQGGKLVDGVKSLIVKNRLENTFGISGKPCWSFLLVNDTGSYSQWEIKTLLMQELLLRGILTIGTHNMSYAHSDEDIGALLGAYDKAFEIIKVGLEQDTLLSMLKCEPIKPLFSIR